MQNTDLAGITLALGKAGIGAGSTTTLSAATVISYAINGKAYTISAISAVQPASTDANTGVALKAIPAGFGAVVLIGYTAAAGTVMAMVQSELTPLGPNGAAFTPGAFIDAPEFPSIPDNFCPVAYAIVKVGTDYTPGASFTFASSGTTATGAQSAAATAFAITYTAIIALPNRPQSA